MSISNRYEEIEYDVYVTPDGEEYDLDLGDDRILLSFEGWGAADIEWITQQGPNQHGVTAIDYRLTPRTVQYLYRSNSNSRLGYWQNRADLLDAIRPNRSPIGTLTPGQLLKYLPNGDVRALDVFLGKGPSFSARDTATWDEYGFTESLRFLAFFPLVYDPEQDCYPFVLNASNQLVFPMTFPFVLGATIINDTLDITYTGTWEAFPTIEIVGPLNVPTILNTSTGKSIKLNYNVAGGQTVTISLGYGNKTVTDQDGTDLTGTVDNPSDLATFTIQPHPIVAGGVNTLQVLGSGANSETGLNVGLYKTYYGI